MANEGMRTPSAGETDRRAMRHESHASTTYKNFLKDLCSLSGMDEQKAECAAVSVLCNLEQRIYGEEARDLEAQLPSRLRELLQRCPRHQGKPSEKFGRDELFRRVADELQVDRSEAEPITRSVFSAVRAQITEGEATDVADQLPSDLADLWRLPA